MGKRILSLPSVTTTNNNTMKNAALILDNKINDLYNSIVEGRETNRQTAFIKLKQYREEAQKFRDTKHYESLNLSLVDTHYLAEEI